MRSCPSCLKDVPSFWNTCQFCGNVFRKNDFTTDEPTMFCWTTKMKK